MSTYTTSTTLLTMVTRPTMSELVEQALRQVESEGNLEWVSSRQLSALAAPTGALTHLKAGQPVSLTGIRPATARQRHQDLAAKAMARALVRTASRDLLQQSESLLAQAEEADRLGARVRAGELAQQADDKLSSAVHATAQRLSVDERRYSSVAAQRVLGRLGYQIDHHQGQRSEGLFATKGDVAVAMLLENGGVMTIDWAGCVQGACVTPMRELTAAMAEEGIQLHIETRVAHDDSRGGQLISRASMAAKDGRRAVGIVVQHEQGVPEPAIEAPVASPVADRQPIGRLR